MIVVCKVSQCPYHDERGYCAKSAVLGIDQMGMCSVLWRKGIQKHLNGPFTEEMYPKDPIIIMDDAETEVVDATKEEIKKKGESRQKDPTNGDAA